MMKRHLLPALLLILSATVLRAQLPSTQRGVGLVQGNDIEDSRTYIGEAGTYPLATLLTPDVLAPYAGCKVVGIRFALGEDISGSRIFLYKVENNTIGEPIVSQSVRRASTGWNDIYFNGSTTYELTGQETLLVGYNYVETEAMAEAESGAICTAGSDASGGFMLYTEYQGRSGWYSISDLGNLCVQLIVDITSLPGKDIDLSGMLIGPKYKRRSDILDVLLLYDNVGRDSIANYSLAYQIDDRQPVIRHYDESPTDGSWEEEIPIPADLALGRHTFRAYVSDIEGQPSLATRNDTLCEDFILYDQALKRQKHYVEFYTNFRSPYVPFVSSSIDPFAAQRPDIVVVNVHSEETPLSIDEGINYESLYAYTYPTFTIDRHHFYGEVATAFDVNDYVLFLPDMAAGAVDELVAEADLNPAFATVDIDATYDQATRQLHLHLSGDVAPEANGALGSLGLTVLLTEDSIPGRQVVYDMVNEASNWQNDYIHNHVLRHVASAPFGDRLPVVQNRYEADYTIPLDEEWQPENMTAVAFVTKYAATVTPDTAPDMDITNCNSVAVRQVITGIDSAPAGEPDAPHTIHDLQGRRLQPSLLRRGIYIVDGRKVYIK